MMNYFMELNDLNRQDEEREQLGHEDKDYFPDEEIKINMKITFTVPGEPQGKARARTGKNFAYTPEKTVLYENLIKMVFLEATKGLPKPIYTDKKPVILRIQAQFAIPKSTNKKDRNQISLGNKYPTKKPDADNIAKVICDALNKLAYDDDTQIVTLVVEKNYSENPCVIVSIEQLLVPKIPIK